MADDVHELSALYALDALTGEERARFEEHLQSCERCRADLDGFRAAAAQLAFAPEGPAPPEALRGRLLLTARAERPKLVPLRSRRRPSLATALAAAVAVAACAAAIGLGLWAASLHGSLSQARRVEAVVANPSSRRIPLVGARGALYVAPSGRAALAADLPRPPAGKQYEAWVIDTAAHPAGLFSGRTTLLRLPVRPGTVVKVTLEKAGGVSSPTTTPLLSAHA
jgi:anti-sigma factor RsiW